MASISLIKSEPCFKNNQQAVNIQQAINIQQLNILNKLGCVVRMIVDPILLYAECVPNDHRKDAPPFTQMSGHYIHSAGANLMNTQ